MKHTHFEIEGMADLEKKLLEVMPREALNISRRTATKLAAEVRKEIKSKTPEDTGNLKKSIKSKRDKDFGKANLAGASIYTERPFGNHWHLVEHGTQERFHKSGKAVGKMPAQPFVLPTVEEWRGKLPQFYREEFGRQFEKEMAKRSK